VAVRFGVIVAVFVAEKWLPAVVEHFPGREPVPGRHGFIGSIAPDKIRRHYVGRRLPNEFRKQGAANPIKYGSSAEAVGGFRDPQSILAVKYKENTGLIDCKNQGSLSDRKCLPKKLLWFGWCKEFGGWIYKGWLRCAKGARQPAGLIVWWVVFLQLWTSE